MKNLDITKLNPENCPKYGWMCPPEELKAKNEADEEYRKDPDKYEAKIKRMTEWLQKKYQEIIGEDDVYVHKVDKNKLPQARFVEIDGCDAGDILSTGVYYIMGVVIDLDKMTDQEATKIFKDFIL